MKLCSGMVVLTGFSYDPFVQSSVGNLKSLSVDTSTGQL